MDYSSWDYTKTFEGPDESDEHPLMGNVRGSIMRYRQQSPAHFDLNINVKQAFRVEETALTRSSKLDVLFVNFQGTESYICRPKLRKNRRKTSLVPTQNVEIFDKTENRFILLDDFLDKAYPGQPDFVGIEQMQDWWAATGKGFNWTGLPTELKEQVIEHCIRQSSEPLETRRPGKRRNYTYGRFQTGGVYELANKLAEWKALPAVSHQVRAITLRLCFTGTSSLGKNGMWSISVSSPRALDRALQRLSRYYQLIEPDSIPTDTKSRELADRYNQHPMIYPQLKQYATFRHGLRRVHLTLGFIDYFHFFKVTIGGFGRYLHSDSISYEVFEQLPNLSEIIMQLPLKPRQGWKDLPSQVGPSIFHHDDPCPRRLHRVIYERMAELLTLYPDVKVTKFMDGNEEARYNTLRMVAVKERKWSMAAYQELYAECGGGIELEDPVQPGSWALETEEKPQVDAKSVQARTETPIDRSFFPPNCQCEVNCQMVFEGREDKVRGRWY
jgi:hypothetical protein